MIPVLALVGACEYLSRARAEVEAGNVERIDRESLTKHAEKGITLGQAPIEPPPRRSWWRSGKSAKTNGNGYRTNGSLHIDFDLAPQVEEAYQRLGTNLLMPSSNRTVVSRPKRR